MKKNAFTVPELLLAMAVLGVLTALFMPIASRQRSRVATVYNCQSNLKQIELCVIQYIQDYDDRYPQVQNRSGGWMDALQPYAKSTSLFQCGNDSKGIVSGTTDYFYNAHISGKSDAGLFSLKNSRRTILIGDGASNSPTHFSINQLPKSWTLNPKSPALRHLNSESGSYAENFKRKNGANYGFVDGHVKWLTPDRVTNARPNSSDYTFTPS